MDATITHTSGRMRQIFDNNFFLSQGSFAIRFNPPPPETRGEALCFTEGEIQAAAHRHGTSGSLLSAATRQFREEMRQRFLRRVEFRSRNNAAACAAYQRMSADELRRINLRQSWAAWRVIPRALSGLLEKRPLVAFDLCCGLGDSTQVLAHYLPKGSRILGLEYNPAFLAVASRQKYRHRGGSNVGVSFHGQSVLEPFPQIAADVVLCIGAFSVNFTVQERLQVATHAAQVLRSGGLLCVDVEKTGALRHETLDGLRKMGFRALKSASSCRLDRSTQECFVRI